MFKSQTTCFVLTHPRQLPPSFDWNGFSVNLNWNPTRVYNDPTGATRLKKSLLILVTPSTKKDKVWTWWCSKSLNTAYNSENILSQKRPFQFEGNENEACERIVMNIYFKIHAYSNKYLFWFMNIQEPLIFVLNIHEST